MTLADFPRHSLTFGPSPVHPLDRLSAHLGGARVWAKREDVEAFLHHQAAQEADRHLIVGDTVCATPRHVAGAGMEDRAIHSARPDRDVVIHPLLAQHLRHAFGGCHQRVATPVEAAQASHHHRLGPGHVVIAQVRLEPGVHRGEHRQLASARPADCLMRYRVGRGDVHYVGRERLEALAHPGRERQRNAVLSPAGYRKRRHADKLAGRLEGRLLGHRRVDADICSLAQEIADKAVERLVRSVTNIVVVARK